MTKGTALILAVAMLASSSILYLGMGKLGLSIRQAAQNRQSVQIEGSSRSPIIVEIED